jgi:hypothetical protein
LEKQRRTHNTSWLGKVCIAFIMDELNDEGREFSRQKVGGGGSSRRMKQQHTNVPRLGSEVVQCS